MKKLDKISKNANQFEITDDNKIIIMSDCHRGAGNNDESILIHLKN